MIKIIAVLLLATNAASASVWDGCEGTLTVENSVFSHISDSPDNMSCEVAFWPIKNPVALLQCDNGKTATYETVGTDKIIFNGAPMYLRELDIDACTAE